MFDTAGLFITFFSLLTTYACLAVCDRAVRHFEGKETIKIDQDHDAAYPKQLGLAKHRIQDAAALLA